MATYAQLNDIGTGNVSNGALFNQIRVACIISAASIMAEAPATTNHANRLLWAKQTFADPNTAATKMIWAVLAANANATQAQILSATDAQVQSNVNAAVDVFANPGTV